MKTSNITSSILLLALSVPTIAWGVAFYSGQACNEDSGFSDVMYYGVGKKGTAPCMSWGDGAEGVTCYNYEENGSVEGDCDFGHPPWIPQSAYFPCGTLCGFGYDSTCDSNEYQMHNEQCINLTSIPGILRAEGDTNGWLTFECFDGGSVWDKTIGCGVTTDR